MSSATKSYHDAAIITGSTHSAYQEGPHRVNMNIVLRSTADTSNTLVSLKII
jgi:hypothetical protein